MMINCNYYFNVEKENVKYFLSLQRVCLLAHLTADQRSAMHNEVEVRLHSVAVMLVVQFK